MYDRGGGLARTEVMSSALSPNSCGKAPAAVQPSTMNIRTLSHTLHVTVSVTPTLWWWGGMVE